MALKSKSTSMGINGRSNNKSFMEENKETVCQISISCHL